MADFDYASHIALFMPSLAGGGAERVMVSVARGLAERGHYVDLVLVKADGPYLSEVPGSVRIIDLGASRLVSSVPALARYLHATRPRAILGGKQDASVIAFWAKMLARVPMRVVAREANVILPTRGWFAAPKEGVIRHLAAHLYRRVDAVIAVSQGVASSLERIGVPREKLRVIYNPVLPSDLAEKAACPVTHPWFASGQPPVILGVGRLVPQKDFHTLIKAFALVRAQASARLVILGESVTGGTRGDGRAALEETVRRLGLNGDVDMPGFVDNPFAYMKRAAVFVLSSRWEGLPNVLIQALALGVPVVSTDCPGGPAEILENGRWGRLVPVGDESALAQAILETLKRPKPPVDPQALARFAVDTVVKQYEDVLLGIPSRGANFGQRDR